MDTMDAVSAADGTRIVYKRSGAGPSLILVHGSAVDHTSWDRVQPSLSECFTVYAIDRRGRGLSGATDSATYTIEREALDIAAVIAIAGEPIYLLGHSYGALCALEAALLTSRIRKLILYEPPMPFPPGQAIGPPGVLETMASLLAAGDNEALLLTFAQQVAHVPEEMIAATRADPAKWRKLVDAAPTLVNEVGAVSGYRFDPDRLRDLMSPTLLLLGGESPPFLRAATEALASALPCCRILLLPGQGHHAMETDPRHFTGEVTRFLIGSENG